MREQDSASSDILKALKEMNESTTMVQEASEEMTTQSMAINTVIGELNQVAQEISGKTIDTIRSMDEMINKFRT